MITLTPSELNALWAHLQDMPLKWALPIHNLILPKIQEAQNAAEQFDEPTGGRSKHQNRDGRGQAAEASYSHSVERAEASEGGSDSPPPIDGFELIEGDLK